MSPTLVIGIDVGGTNTDAVLLDTRKTGVEAVASWNKTPTSSNVTSSLRKTLEGLLKKWPGKEGQVAAVTLGTTHFLNAILEHDASRLEKVAVIRLTDYDFTRQTPPFIDWPPALCRLMQGHVGFVRGGVNIDGSLIAELDEEALVKQAEIIRSKQLRNVVIVGVGSPMDTQFGQENRARRILQARLLSVNVTCSHEIAGSGILFRENASILNASTINFARRTIRGFARGLANLGLNCPLYLTSNTGHVLSFVDAIQFPIRVFSSGPTNSLRGAAYLAGQFLGSDGAAVVDIGGTTSDVGFLLHNGYPRLASSHIEIAGVKVNLDVLQVDSTALGGGSILHTSPGGRVRVGPDSVGYEISTKALCFGGSTATATDVAVVTGGAAVGTTAPSSLSRNTAEKAAARIKSMLEGLIDRVKTSPEPCTVILVGGGVPLCPQNLEGVYKVVRPDYAAVANAVGAAIAQVGGRAEQMTDSKSVETVKIKVKMEALEDAQWRGGDISAAMITKEEVVGVPYTVDSKNVYVEVSCPADHGRFYSTSRIIEHGREREEEKEGEEVDEEGEKTVDQGRDNTENPKVVDVASYRPAVDSSGVWTLSRTDAEFLALGCYILGCGGGGSPYGTYLQLINLVEQGKPPVVVDASHLQEDAVIVPVAGVGSPAVANERPGGNLVLHALRKMEEETQKSYGAIFAVEVGGGNGLQPLIWGSPQHYGIPCVDGDLMGFFGPPAYTMRWLTSDIIQGGHTPISKR